jgi:hypothetical protein
MNSLRHNLLSGTGNQGLQRNLSDRLMSTPFVSNPRTLLSGAPLPSLEEIPAGFDAIFQFRSDLLGQYLSRNITTTLGELNTEIDYDKSSLPQPIWNELRCRILAAHSRGTTGSTSLTLPNVLDPTVELLGEALDNSPTVPLIITVEESREPRTPKITFDLGQQPANDTEVRWRIMVEVLVPKASSTTATGTPEMPGGPSLGLTTDTFVGLEEVRIPPPSIAFPTMQVERIRISWGEAVTSARLHLSTLAPTFQVSAQLDFANANIVANPLDDYFRCAGTGTVVINPENPSASRPLTLFGALLDHDNQLLDAIRAAFGPLVAASTVNITPRMALGGGNTLQGLGNFHARAVATQGNTLLGQVLSLCVDVGNIDGDLGLVRPFVADQNYGYYVSEPLVQAAMLSRWASVSPREQIFPNVDVPLIDNRGDEHIGQATIRVRFLTLTQVQIGVASGSSFDPISLTGTYEVELQKLLDHEGNDITNTDAIRPLIKPETLGYQIYLFPFQTQSSQDIPSRLLRTIGHTLLQPLYFPVVGGEGQFRMQLYGRTSDALDAVFIRGNLSLL